MLDGVTVGGHRLDDEKQFLNLGRSAKQLSRLVETGFFQLTIAVSDKIHALVAYREVLEWAAFRGEGQEKSLTPPLTEPGGKELIDLDHCGCTEFTRIPHPCERGMVYFLFAALQQFYFDGNKRTGRFMMNGELMNHG